MMLRKIMEYIGYEPIKETAKTIQYFSPFNTAEKTPSFFILKSNSGNFDYFKDHSKGEKGKNYFSFLMEYFTLSFNDSVKKWHEINGTTREFIKVDKREYSYTKVSLSKSVIELISTEPIKNDWLLKYLYSRGIHSNSAIDSIIQVNYSVNGKKYNSVGIKNEAGGYNHRNQNVKGVIGKTDISILGDIKNPIYIIIFEGLFNYLSHVQLFGYYPHVQYVIMNSTSNTNRAINHIAMTLDCMDSSPKIELWLDNGTSGDISTIKIMNCFPLSVDKRKDFAKHDDLNDKLTNTLKTKREIRIIKKEEDYVIYKEGKELFRTNDLNIALKQVDTYKK